MLFTLILLGYISNKKGIISQSLNKELSNVILYITLPALVIKSMQYDFSKDMIGKSIKIVLISVSIYLITIVLSYLVVKSLKLEGKIKDIIQFLLIFPNVGFMGYPVISSIYGDSGVFYTALFNMPFNILVWTIGVIIMSRSSREESSINIKKIFLNPGVSALVVGYTLFLLSIKLPRPIYDLLNMLGSATTPMAMIVVGSILAQSKIQDAFKNKYLLIVSFLRLLFIPFGIYIVLKNVFSVDGLVLGVTCVIPAMPCAANAAIFATRFDNDHILASQGVFITTLFSIITIPILVVMLQA
jgi:predicted permease